MRRCDAGEIAGEQPSLVCRPETARGKQKLLKQAIEVLLIEVLLADEQRPGAPASFTFEQFMQIMVATL